MGKIFTDTTFCPLPFMHTNIKHGGKVSLCWRHPSSVGNFKDNSISEIWNNQKIRDVRKQFLTGKYPEKCYSCWDMEKSGIKSTRQQSIEKFRMNKMMSYEKAINIVNDDFSMPLDVLQHIEIRFSNKCNLICRHCNQDYSSGWEAILKNNPNNKIHKYKTVEVNKVNISKILPEIENISKNINYIMISGGEPLYNLDHYKFLERLLPYAKNITLSYNSNLNTLTYAGYNIIELWKHFKCIDIRVSIDGDRETYEYFRVNGKINKIESNIKELQKLKNIKLYSTCTTNLLNITHFIKILEYFLSLKTYFHTSLVQDPTALNIKLLPKELKKQITNEWNEWLDNIDSNLKRILGDNIIGEYKRSVLKFGNMVITYMNSEDLFYLWGDFLEYAKGIDELHGTNIYDIFPEYKGYDIK